jgi:hypothetical protein
VRRGPTSVTEFEVSLEDVYKGASIDVCQFFFFPCKPPKLAKTRTPQTHAQFMIKKRVLCDHCRGSGAASDGDIHSCSECGGSGVRVVKQQIFPGMYAQSQVTCNSMCRARPRHRPSNAQRAPAAKSSNTPHTSRLTSRVAHLRAMRSSLKARATRAPIGNLAMSSFASALELRRAAGAGRRVAFIGRRRSASTRCVFVFFSRISDLFIRL